MLNMVRGDLMNILITVATYYPKKDGVQMVTQYLAEGLANIYNHNVTIITSKCENSPDEEFYNNVKIKRINLTTKCGLYFGEKDKYKELFKKNCEENDVVINVCTQTAFTDLILELIPKIKKKKILYMHGMFDFTFSKYNFSSLRNIINKLWKQIRWSFYYKKNAENFKYYDEVIQINEKCPGYDFFKEKYNITPKVIKNAVDDNFFDNKNLKLSKKYAICVANYLPDKGQIDTLRAYYQSKDSKSLDMIFIGSSNTKYYNKLLKVNQKLERKYGKRNVEFLYNISRSETIEYIKNSYLFLFNSKYEMYPLSIIECCASGVPFISNDVGCVSSIAGGKIITNIFEMSKMIDKLCSDKDEYNSLSKAGLKYAKEYAVKKKNIEKLNSILNIK